MNSSDSDRNAEVGEQDLNDTVDLIALSVGERALRCRLLHTGSPITLRAPRFWSAVPGEIVTVRPNKEWRFKGHDYLSGRIESIRLDANALGLSPLRLRDEGIWEPSQEYWGEEGEGVENCLQPVLARGPRPVFKMEHILPGEDPSDLFADPITIANDLKDAGDVGTARGILMDLCHADLRCLDAHAHLGAFEFDFSPRTAQRHFEVGLRIGELSLGAPFDDVLLWGHIDNRPFLRCMKGYGLCLWRQQDFDGAERLFERMLYLNPPDNQGARFLIEDVRAGTTWEQSQAVTPLVH